MKYILALPIVLFFPALSCAAGFDDDLAYDYGNAYWDKFARNLNKNINQEVRHSLRGLDNLGAVITQRVHEGLRPVREMEFAMRIKYGRGGTTIANFKDKRFVIRDGVMYVCDGTISEEGGSCSGTLQKATFNKKEDFCFASVKSVINNWYCLGNGNINSGAINGKVFCSSNDGSSTLLISADEYKNLCGGKTNPITYKYFTYQPLGEYGPDVHCSGQKPFVCIMTESNRIINNMHVVGSGSFVQIQS